MAILLLKKIIFNFFKKHKLKYVFLLIMILFGGGYLYLSKILDLQGPVVAMAATETRYYRNSSTTVNGLNTNYLGTANTTTGDNLLVTFTRGGGRCGFLPPQIGTWSSDVIIRHQDGSQTVLGTNIATTSIAVGNFIANPPVSGYRTATWNTPSMSLAPSDALVIVEKISFSSGVVSRSWVSDQLNATQLNAGTWTFNRYIRTNLWTGSGDCTYQFYLYYGDSTNYNTRIENISYSSGGVDIGLRVFDGTQIVPIAAEPLGTLTSPLRIGKNGNTYGVVLVDILDPNASKVRINTSGGVKALMKMWSWSCGDTFTYNGDSYSTVQMPAAYGGKCWLGENLRTTKKPDGVTDITTYCNPAGCGSPWGRLYDWNTMMNGSPAATGCGAKIQGICPNGWHIPSDYTGCSGDDFEGLGTAASATTGGPLKKTGTTEWVSPNTGATNVSNFTAYPAGISQFGQFLGFYGTGGRGYNAYLWSSSEYNYFYGWARVMQNNTAWFWRYRDPKTESGHSVRCVKD